MKRRNIVKRRDFLATIAAGTAALATPAVRAASSTTVLKYVPQADLALLDPCFTPALVTRNHAYLVYDTLYGVDEDARPQPQMALGHVIENGGLTWTITLREGLCFHDGEKVLARDVAASLRRWGSHDVYAMSVFTQVDEVTAPSDNVLQIQFKRPFRLLLGAIRPNRQKVSRELPGVRHRCIFAPAR